MLFHFLSAFELHYIKFCFTMEDIFYYLAFLLVFLLFLIKQQLIRPRRNLPPSPPGLPIIGHIHLLRNPHHQSLARLSSKHGPILFLRFGSRPTLLVSSPSAAEECFTKNDIVFANRPRSMAGDHLTYNYTTFAFAPYGDLWRCLRRLAVIELFSSRSLQKSSVSREEEIGSFLRLLSQRSRNGKQRIGLNYWLPVLTFNIVMRLVSDERLVDYEIAESEEGKRILEDIKDRFAPGTPLGLCDYFPILKWIGYKGMEKNVLIHHKKRDEFLAGLLDNFRKKEKANLTGDGEKKPALIESLLRLQESDPGFYSEDLIKSVLSIMFIAGTGTSVITMVSAMSLLLSHRKALQKVTSEIDDQIGCERLVRDSDLAKLPFLHCVINEALRLCPPAPLLLPHYASEDCTVGGFWIPRGTTLIVNAWALHRDPKLWEDPEEFKPERFESMVATGDKEGCKFIPFGMGRRECPGNNLGLRIVSLAIGSLVQCFNWEKVDGPDHAESLDVMYSLRENSTDLFT